MHLEYNNPHCEYTMGGERLIITASKNFLIVVIYSALKPAAHMHDCIYLIMQFIS